MAQRPYVLGLDIGTNSVGWALVELNGVGGEPKGLLTDSSNPRALPSMGVRLFEAGMEHLGAGKKEESHGVKRRTSRLQRRQLMRRARKRRRVFHLLQEAGLLPAFKDGAWDACGGQDPARDQLLKTLDEELGRTLAASDSAFAPECFERLPYLLRGRALDFPLRPHELGRVLYHLAQRRGFKSNRKADSADDESGVIKSAIGELGRAMEEVDPATGKPQARTLGEYLLGLDPRVERLRSRWTARRMYEEEFDAIWSAQAPHHPESLTDDFRKRLRRALFHQRPLKSQRHLIGLCEFENGKDRHDIETGEIMRTKKSRRAAACLPLAQRFILLQKVNDLTILTDVPGNPGTALDEGQRKRLAAELETTARMSFAQVKKVLGLPREARFNLQAGGEKGLPGNRTNTELRDLFGDRWGNLTPTHQEQIILELWSEMPDKSLIRRATERRGIWKELAPTKEEASKVPGIAISHDYSNLSRRALFRIVPLMEEGIPYVTAARKVYGLAVSRSTCDSVPSVQDAFGDLRNPVVMRALTETRKVVNALIREHGKPDMIRTELARDLKANAEQRMQMSKSMRENENRRVRAAEKIVQEAGISDPRPGDILKARLWEECAGVCPYTGKSIGFRQLFGEEIDVEHILPFSRSMDDSYINKTLCFASYNRTVKGNKTPFEAAGGDEAKWTEMVNRMERSVDQHGMPAHKLVRFQLAGSELEDHLDGFVNRQLSDTRYASKKSREYLMSLYGGQLERGVDGEGRERVAAGNGQATALLRRGWGVSRFLGGGEKTRDDHRHHAVDALVTALTTPSRLQVLTREWQEAQKLGYRWPRLQHPWEGFEGHVRSALDAIWVSQRTSSRVRGPLHAETMYSAPRDEGGRIAKSDTAGKTYSHVRVALEKMRAADIDRIVDPIVQAAVRAKLVELGKTDPGKAFDPENPDTYPLLGKSRPTRVRKARLRKANSTRQIAAGHRRRHVENSENHHIELVEYVDAKGREKWDGVVVSLPEAVRRKAAGEPIVQRDHGPGRAFQFSLVNGDVFEAESSEGVLDRFRVKVITPGQVKFQRMFDARVYAGISKAGLVSSPNALRGRFHRKLTVSPAGTRTTNRA